MAETCGLVCFSLTRPKIKGSHSPAPIRPPIYSPYFPPYLPYVAPNWHPLFLTTNNLLSNQFIFQHTTTTTTTNSSSSIATPLRLLCEAA